MSNSIVEYESEEIDCTWQVSDEAIEITAGADQENGYYTLGACTGLSVCPG
jgi:hypothetical protein